MARKNDSPPPPERSRVRFMVLEVDGTSDDIKTLAQTFAQAVRAPQQPPLPARPAPIALNEAPSAPPAAAPVSPGLFDDVEPDAPEAGADTPPAPAATAPPKPSNGAKKKLRTPQLISSLEFNGGEKSLADFVNELKPKDHSKRYLVITQWLKKYRNIAEVGADHVYTCYRALDMNVPKDVLSVFRALKSQGWVESGAEEGLFKITHVGENQLTKLKG